MSLQAAVRRSVIACACVLITCACASKAPVPEPSAMRDVLVRVPLSFEANQGQAEADVKFVSRGPGHTLLLTSDRAVLQLVQPKGLPVMTLRLGSANPAQHVEPSDPLPGQVNYLIGNDPAKWRFDVPHYAKVRYREAYPGTDVIFYGNQRGLEYDLVVSPGADPAAIAMQFDNVTNLSLDAEGDLILDTDGGRIEQGRPVIYQEINGLKNLVDGRYVLRGTSEVAFEVGAYDLTRPLVIDPTVAFFTYLGGGDDGVTSMALDSTSNLYVAGATHATNFPLMGAFQPTPGGGYDGFVTKFAPGGSTMIFSTYMGGNGDDFIRGIAVAGRAGNVYFAGDTESTNFPTFIPFQSANRGHGDGFLGELNTAGTGLVFSTYFGGSGEDHIMSLGLDADSNIFLTGFTSSSADFTLVRRIQQAFGGGNFDAFLTEFNPQGTQPLLSTFHGGDGDDAAFAVAVDPVTRRPVITGGTDSRNFFTTPGAPQSTLRGGSDIFVTSFDPAGTARPFSTYFGGTGDDFAVGIAPGPNGLFGITGVSASRDFPLVNSQAQFGGGDSDMFALELAPSLNGSPSAVRVSTLIGGAGADAGYSVAFDPRGGAVFTGDTNSSDLRLINPVQPGFAGGENDVLLVFLNNLGSVQTQSHFGGPGADSGLSVIYDLSTDSFWIGGASVTPQNQQKGFVARFRDFPPPAPPPPPPLLTKK